MLQVLPNGRQIAGSNRTFMRRAVEYMVQRGITQFLDLGSGIPTAGNVHEVAQRANPACRVVYVDYDEVAVAHSELMLEGNENAGIVAADFTQPRRVLDSEPVHRLLDLSQPVGLLMVAVLHFVSDEANPGRVVAAYRDAIPSGSLVALSHLTADHKPAEMGVVTEAMKHSRDPMYFRRYDQVVALFDGLELVEPGVVSAPQWHPEAPAGGGPEDIYVGVGRVP